MTSLPESIKFTFTACSGVAEPSLTDGEMKLRTGGGVGPKVIAETLAQVLGETKPGYRRFGLSPGRTCLSPQAPPTLGMPDP